MIFKRTRVIQNGEPVFEHKKQANCSMNIDRLFISKNNNISKISVSFSDILLALIGGIYLTVVRHHDSFIIRNQNDYFI